MSSYRDKYHLLKVEPVKGRAKGQTQPVSRPAPKVEKGNLMMPPPKRKIRPHQHYFTHGHIHTHTTTSLQQIHSPSSPTLPQQEAAPIKQRAEGTHRSLEFRSLRQISMGDKIINTIQGFFKELLESDEGCSCEEPCPEAARLFKWVDVPLEIIKEHYSNVSAKWRDMIGREEGQEDSEREVRKAHKQILKDRERTQSESATFRNPVFLQRMTNILMAYAVEDPKVGYVQGMNLVLSGVLFHVRDEVKAYAVLRNLVYAMRGVYLSDFEECRGHTARLRGYLSAHVHDLSLWLEELGADLDMICLPWFISLMACLVPLDSLHLIYAGFIADKWQFIYRVALALLVYLKQPLLECLDPGEVNLVLSPSAARARPLDWEDIVLYSNTITL